jgi:hypothetical protein
LKESAEHVIQSAAPIPAIRLGSRETNDQPQWTGLMLVLVMRALALLWLAEGAMHWVSLLSAPGDGFATMSAQRLAAVYFFCVMDFIAAIGLWLATPWGGVVWLVTVGVQILAFVLLPGFWAHGVVLMMADAVLVPFYLWMAWYAGQGDGE